MLEIKGIKVDIFVNLAFRQIKLIMKPTTITNLPKFERDRQTDRQIDRQTEAGRDGEERVVFLANVVVITKKESFVLSANVVVITKKELFSQRMSW